MTNTIDRLVIQNVSLQHFRLKPLRSCKFRPKKKKESTQNTSMEKPGQHVEPMKEEADPELRIVEEALARAQRLHLMHQKVRGSEATLPHALESRRLRGCTSCTTR